jgi:hypothetical protein
MNCLKTDEWVSVLPKQADNQFQGYKIAVWIFLLITIFTIVRSCIHIFAPEGGAGSIAGIDVSVSGGSNIVSMFAFWGLSQLLMGVVYLVVFFRYKSLISFMYVLILAEYSGRIFLGIVKPLQVSHTPPGAIGDYILVPLAIVMLILSLRRPNKKSTSEQVGSHALENSDKNQISQVNLHC